MTTNSMTYNGLDTRVGMTDSTGSRTFRRAGIGVTSPVLSDGSASFTPSGENRAGVKTAYHGGLKSFDSQTNSAQAVVGQRLTDAFGNQISSSGVWKGRFAYGGPYGYQEDPDTGLRLLGHRYYDSSTGRFLTRDPIKDGRNWYVYCDNEPITRTDPTGLIHSGGPSLAGGATALTDPDKPGPHNTYMNDWFNDDSWGDEYDLLGRKTRDQDWNRNQDCATFVCYLIRKYYDQTAPTHDTTALLNYLIGSDLWTEIPYDPTGRSYLPGDVIITAPTRRRNDGSTGHVAIWIGNGMIAQASLGNELGPHRKSWGKAEPFFGKAANSPRVFRPVPKPKKKKSWFGGNPRGATRI